MADNLALGTEFLQCQVAVFQYFGILKTEFFSSLLHLLIEFFLHLTRTTFQDLPCLGDVLLISLVLLLTDTGSFAVVDVVFQAGFVLALLDPFSCDGEVTAAGFVQLLDEIQHLIHIRYVRVGAEIAACSLVDGARLEDAREEFVGNTDAGVGLSVFQEDIVARIVLLDETVFQQQGVLFGVDNGIGNVVNLTHQNLGLEPVNLLMEIGGNTALQTLGFAYINNGVRIVIELVASWFLRHAQHDVLQIR